MSTDLAHFDTVQFVALAVLVVLVLVTVWIVPRVWRLLRGIVARIVDWLDGARRPAQR
ncbi:MAG: hypothetical protein IT522_15415 [Burkholderiales bacterium]|nr:hypothetical protein [Burkholderiales bacterium]